MTELQLKAALAGLFFGIWPLLMHRSGLSGNVSSAAFGLGAFLVVLPFALPKIGQIGEADKTMIILSCLLGGFGLLSFNGMLSKATKEQVGPLIVLMTVVQIAVPALYQVVIAGKITIAQGAGFAAAILAAILLI